MNGGTRLSVAAWSPKHAARATRRTSQTMAVVAARTGDHHAALQFLNSVLRAPSPGEFRASLEDPFYEPHDRLLIKRGHEIFGHAQITHRAMRFGRSLIPVAGFQWLAASPEIRGRGLGTLLLRRAERLAVERGAAAGLLATAEPAFFKRAGWIPCGDRNRLTANVCRILAVLAARGDYPKIRRPLDIRPVRRMEIADLARIYRRNTEIDYGPLERTEAYWHWLINRRAYEEILVAIDRGRRRNRPPLPPSIVGYAVLRAGHVVELLTAPESERAPIQLLSRACGEAIERGIDRLSLHLPDGHPLADILQEAGADSSGGPHGREVLMAKVLSPERMLEKLSGELVDRAGRAVLETPLELGFAVAGRKYQVAVEAADTAANGEPHPARTSVVAGSIGRSYLRLDPDTLSKLLLGGVDWTSDPVAVEVSTKLAHDAAVALFPPRTIWRPLFDDLVAR